MPSTARALPEIVDAVGGEVEVLVDGGIRTGLDVVKMLSLGARAVLLGRAWAWAVAAQGETGRAAHARGDPRRHRRRARADRQPSVADLDRSALYREGRAVAAGRGLGRRGSAGPEAFGERRQDHHPHTFAGAEFDFVGNGFEGLEEFPEVAFARQGDLFDRLVDREAQRFPPSLTLVVWLRVLSPSTAPAMVPVVSVATVAGGGSAPVAVTSARTVAPTSAGASR